MVSVHEHCQASLDSMFRGHLSHVRTWTFLRHAPPPAHTLCLCAGLKYSSGIPHPYLGHSHSWPGCRGGRQWRCQPHGCHASLRPPQWIAPGAGPRPPPGGRSAPRSCTRLLPRRCRTRAPRQSLSEDGSPPACRDAGCCLGCVRMPGLEAQAIYTQLAQAVKELHTLPVHLDQHGRHTYSHATQRWTCRCELLCGATHLN